MIRLWRPDQRGPVTVRQVAGFFLTERGKGIDETMSKTPAQRERMMETLIQKGWSKYLKTVVAKMFQRMVRAEAAAQPTGYTNAIDDGMLIMVYRHVGECVCVTCGKVLPWNVNGMDSGHLISRAYLATLLDPDNCAPQCVGCNQHYHGKPNEFRQWLVAVRGMETVVRLEELKRKTVEWSRDDLVDMRIEYGERLRAAEAKMKGM